MDGVAADERGTPAGHARVAMLEGPRWMTDPADAVLASLRCDAEALPQLHVTIAADGSHAVGEVSGHELWSIRVPRQRWLEVLTGQIVATVTMLLRRLVFVHAGSVAIHDGALLLVGDSGAGKTSTVSALLTCGAAYLSDEVALLDPEAGTVLAFHLPMVVKPWTARAAGPLPPGRQVATQGAVRFHLPIRLARAAPLRTVVFLERGDPPRLRELSRAAAMLRLAQQASSFRYGVRVDDAFRAWARAVRTARCVQLQATRPAALAAALSHMGADDRDAESR